MNTKYFTKLCSSMLLGVALALMVGCGGGGSGGGAEVNTAEVQLEAKVAQGDGEAAMKLGEIFAAKSGDRGAQIEAAKWFHIGGRLGNGNASMGLAAVTGQMSLEN